MVQGQTSAGIGVTAPASAATEGSMSQPATPQPLVLTPTTQINGSAQHPLAHAISATQIAQTVQPAVFHLLPTANGVGGAPTVGSGQLATPPVTPNAGSAPISHLTTTPTSQGHVPVQIHHNTPTTITLTPTNVTLTPTNVTLTPTQVTMAATSVTTHVTMTSTSTSHGQVPVQIQQQAVTLNLTSEVKVKTEPPEKNAVTLKVSNSSNEVKENTITTHSDSPRRSLLFDKSKANDKDSSPRPPVTLHANSNNTADPPESVSVVKKESIEVVKKVNGTQILKINNPSQVPHMKKNGKEKGVSSPGGSFSPSNSPGGSMVGSPGEKSTASKPRFVSKTVSSLLKEQRG